MPRRLRSELPDGPFHVTIRGNRRAPIFSDAIDKTAFVRRLEQVSEKVVWRWQDFCLMPNHAHLVVECAVTQLSKGMQLLAGGFAQWFNKRHETTGHHFQGRYFAEPIAGDQHRLELVRYLALNPVRAGLCGSPQFWPWSSYAALIGEKPRRDFLHLEDTLELFASDASKAIRRLREFVEGAGDPLPLSAWDMSGGQTPGHWLGWTG